MLFKRTALLAALITSLLPASPAYSASSEDSLQVAMQEVVEIRTDTGSGAGFWLEDGRVLTAAHVVAGADEISVVTASGGAVPAAVKAISSRLDLALLETERHGSAGLAISEVPRIGAEVFAAGNPQGGGVSVSKGIVSAVRSEAGVDYVQTDAAVNPGNSGGPLLNLDGEVVGVVVLKVSDVEGIGLAVAANEITGFISGERETDKAEAADPVPPPGSIVDGDRKWPAALVLLVPLALIVFMFTRRDRPLPIKLKERPSPRTGG